MIYALNMTCARDWDLRNLMLSTYEKYSGFTSWISKDSGELKDYGNGAGWGPSMMKLDLLRDLLDKFPVQDNDFVLSVDSDVIFTSPEVFKYANPAYGIIGIKHKPEFETLRGQWSHMSGALIFIRGDIAKQMCQFSEATLSGIRFKHFKPFAITENEDVVLSYLAFMCNANQFDLGCVPGLTSGDFENDVSTFKKHCDFFKMVGGAAMLTDRGLKSFYHLNYCPTQFLGEPVTGKWDIPRILQMKGIEL